MTTLKLLLAALTLTASGVAAAGSVVYKIDPEHTYPSFEADHLGGLSVWRGKFNKTSGTITLDKAGAKGQVDVTVDMVSADFGHEKLNEIAKSKELFETGLYPRATYKGKLGGFVGGKPTRVDGELNLHGVSRPLALKINSFKCMPHPMFKREVCGADALGSFKRDVFGMVAGKDYGFSMDVTLRIQVEALAQ